MRPMISRRRLLAGAAGAAGAVALAACGETQIVEVERIVTQEVPVERIVEKMVPVERIVEKIVTREVAVEVEKVVTREVQKIVEVAAPQQQISFIRYVSNHISGPRAKATQWALERFAQIEPNIHVRFEPAGHLNDILGVQFAAGTAPDTTLSSQSLFIGFQEGDNWLEVTDLLDKNGLVREDYYFVPDDYTDNKIDHSFPALQFMTGPQFGMPFQVAISGFLGNITLAEESGVELPQSENSWTWADWTEMDSKITNPDTDSYGTWARNDYEFQYMPQMYSNGLKKPFNDALTKSMFDLPEAQEAMQYLVDKIFVGNTSPPAELTKELGGEFGDPFVAGRIGIWPSGRVYSTGRAIPRIKDRFRWTLMPEVNVRAGMEPGHGWNDQANMVTATARTNGTEEASTLFVMFMAGEEVSERVGIDRGHMPCHRTSIAKPESQAPPPEGMKWLKVYGDRTNTRHLYTFNEFPAWNQQIRPLTAKAFIGEATVAEALQEVQEQSARLLRNYSGAKPFVSSPVYP